MTEQNISNSNDIPSTFYIKKESIPLETRRVNSLIRRSLSNKLNVLAVTPPPTMNTISPSSTASLAMQSIELGSITQSTQHQQSIIDTTISMTMIPTDEGRIFNDDVKRQESLPDVEKCTSLSDSDNDSFTDEDEAIINESLYSLSPLPILSNYITMSCPICIELSPLQSSSCCTFHCCNSCWRSHIAAVIDDGRIKISCISNECNKYLTKEFIVNLIRYDTTLYERYLKVYTNANQNSRAKLCPRCSHLYSLDKIPLRKKKSDKKIPKQVQCPECSLVWCFRCSAPWHENLTCKQFIKGDKLLLKWINQKNEDQWNARKCPKCSSFIQRAGGCPHMTCSSCSCEFCYLCGRRYCKIPLIGQHSNKFSMFGCPYNFYPERPWLRRTIRGTIATGVVVASPIIAVGALAAAVTVLPSIGIYRLVKHVRSRRHRGPAVHEFLYAEQVILDQDHEQQQQPNGSPTLDFHGEYTNIANFLESVQRPIALNNTQTNDENINENWPLSIFANMDVENLFSDNDNDDKLPLDFRTCPTTPATNIRKQYSKSLDNITTMNHLSINRHHSINVEA